MEWSVQTFNLIGYTLIICSDNIRTIKLYDRLGFRILRKIPLVFEEGNNGFKLVEK